MAAESSNPNLAVALDSGKVRAIPGVMDAIATTYLQIAWVTTKDASAKRPDMVRAFAHAFGEACTYTNAHHDDTVALSSEFTGVQAPLIAKMARALAWPTVVAAHIQPVIEATVRFGSISKSFPAADLIDPNIR